MKDFLFWNKIKKASKLVLLFYCSIVKRASSRLALFTRTIKIISHKLGLFLIPILLFLIAAVLWSISQLFSWQMQILQLNDNPFLAFQATSYPLVERRYEPDISAQAAYVMETISRVPIFVKNPTIRFSPASTTKIMTALTALDYYHPDNILTIQRDFVEGSGLHLVKGEKFYFKDLLYAMMLPSANDAAYAIADNYPGGMSAFVAKMNAKAVRLHLVDTHYQDSAGLQDDGDYTTAHDLAILAAVSLGDPFLAQVVDTKNTIIASIDKTYVYPIKNLNELLGLYGVIGVKTGYTDEAGQVLVTASKQNNHIFIIVVMKSDDRFADTEKLLQYISDNVSYVSMQEK